MYYRVSARVTEVRFEIEPGWFCASLLFAHFLWARAFLFFFFCVEVVVDTVGFYTQLYHLRLTFFRWENAVEMFVIYTLCCPIVFLFASLRFLLYLCLLYKCNSMDSIKMNVESKINKIASPFCARFDFSFVSWWEKVDDTMRCDALRYDTRSFGLALCDGQLFCCCSSFLFFFCLRTASSCSHNASFSAPVKTRMSQSESVSQLVGRGWLRWAGALVRPTLVSRRARFRGSLHCVQFAGRSI